MGTQVSPDLIYKHVQKRVEELDKALQNRINDIQAYTQNMHDHFENWTEIQNSKIDQLEDKLSEKIDRLTEIISRKSEMDSALIAKVQNIMSRVEKIEIAKTKYDKSIASLNVKVDQLLSIMTKHSLDKMSMDINNAHEKLRDHEKRLRPLEKAEGERAKKYIWFIITLLGGLAMGVLTSLILKSINV